MAGRSDSEGDEFDLAHSRNVTPLVLLIAGWVLALLPVGALCWCMGSFHAYGAHSHAQLALSIALCGVVAAWIVVEVSLLVSVSPQRNGKGTSGGTELHHDEECAVKPTVIGDSSASPDPQAGNGDSVQRPDSVPESPKDREIQVLTASPGVVKTITRTTSTVTLLEAVQKPLRCLVEFTAILAVMYVCDRTDLVPRAKKVYDPKQFWALWGFICVAALATMRTLSDIKPMQREQTDEWKGWMQLMFLMYHYFEEKEVYNAIRVYIAAYVWMTGYGNYSLYVRGKSFTTRRTLQMLFRLNFFVFFVCVALNNEYMLYYIAPMHTLFTVFVILTLYFALKMNDNRCRVYMKIGITLLFTVVLYDGPDVVFRSVFGTLPIIRPLLAFHDPVHPEFKDEMHEWHFRSGLDRFIWIIGMVTAVHFADFAAFLAWVDSLGAAARSFTRGALVCVTAAILTVWWNQVFSLSKYDYNFRHPFTSFIPIIAWLLLRNLLPALRKRYLFLFAYLGRVTLETYILQFHVWMKTTGVNGSPKHLLSLIPGYYWLNFALTSAVYIFLSVRVFHLTVALRDFFIPDDMRIVAINCGVVVGIAVVSWCVAYEFKAD